MLRHPYNVAVEQLKAKNPNAETMLVNQGIASPFTLALKVSALAGAVLTAPVWLYQLWSFIVPGLLAKEKKWALIFIGAATPLFAAGVAVGYIVMPKGIMVLLGFTQNGVANLQDVNQFLSFLMRFMIVFGVAFLIPLVVLMLNIVGVVKAKQLSKYRTLRDLRHLRLRGRGHAVDRPVLDAGAGGADGGAVPRRRGHRPHPRPAQGRAAPGTSWSSPGWTTTWRCASWTRRGESERP